MLNQPAKWKLFCTCWTLPVYDNQTNDDYNKDNNQSTHSHNCHVSVSFRCFCKREDWMKLQDSSGHRLSHFSTILPWSIKCVALTITAFSLKLNPQKYSPKSDEFTWLILRKTVEVLDVMLNLPFWNPSYSETLVSALFIEEIRVLLRLVSLNHIMWVRMLVKLEHIRVTSWPGWTAIVWNSQFEMEIPAGTNSILGVNSHVGGRWTIFSEVEKPCNRKGGNGTYWR